MYSTKKYESSVKPPSGGAARPNKFSSFLRGNAGRLKGYAADQNGAIAVETAILTPFVLWGLLMAGSLAFSVFNHQKVYTGAYSGASFLHDKIAAGDFSGLKGVEDENGEIQDGEWITTAKLVIKDASGLPLDLNKIDISPYCACPGMNPGELQSADSRDEMDGQVTFYDREAFSVSESGEVCPTSCRNGNKSRIIAEIIIDYDTISLKGGNETIHEKLVTRLR